MTSLAVRNESWLIDNLKMARSSHAGSGAGFLFMLLGTGVSASLQCLMLVVLTKTTDAQTVGTFALGLSFTAPVFLFCQMRMRHLVAANQAGSSGFDDIMGARILLCCLGVMFACGGSLLLPGGDRVPFVVVAGLSLAKAAESVSDLVHGLLQKHEQAAAIALSLCVRGALSFALFWIAIRATHSLAWGVSAMAAASGVALIGCDLPLVRGAGAKTPRFLLDKLFSLTWKSLPLGVAALLVSLVSFIPRFFVARSLGKAELGIFATVAFLPYAGTLVVGALGESVTTRVARLFHAGERRELVHFLLKLFTLGAGLGAVMLVFFSLTGKQLLHVLYGPAYANHTSLLIELTIAGAVSFVASLMNYAMVAIGCFRETLIATLAAAVAIAAWCVYLVPRFGLRGASMAMIVSAAVQVLVSSWYLVFRVQSHTEDH